MRSVHRLCEFNPGICLTTEEKHGNTSVRVVKECCYPPHPHPQYYISLTHQFLSRFGTTRVVGRQRNAPAAFTPREIHGTDFQRLSRPQGTWFCRGDHRKKSPSDTTGNRSRDRPTRRAALRYPRSQSMKLYGDISQKALVFFLSSMRTFRSTI